MGGFFRRPLAVLLYRGEAGEARGPLLHAEGGRTNTHRVARKAEITVGEEVHRCTGATVDNNREEGSTTEKEFRKEENTPKEDVSVPREN